MKTINNYNLRLRTIFFFSFLFFVILSCIPAGQAAAQITSPQEISLQQREQLESLGIDFSDREAAVRKARDLGIPEREIQNALNEYDEQPELTTSQTPVDFLQTEDTIVISAEDTEEFIEEFIEQAVPEDVNIDAYAGKGRWRGLRYYGYDIFESSGESVSPIEIGPVDP